MYSIIELNKQQYKVEYGKPLLVDKIETSGSGEGEIKIDRVLFQRDDKNGVKIGTPYIKGLVLKAKVLETVKGKKIRVFKYKKRKDYRRTIGTRPQFSKIIVEEQK
jgi:large subunit ribosomal protein L21